ncbi:MAG: hypothetical protein HRU33_03845 [Rhodobacteraceae bacterium]|nr:hypothetical protein [Paracoccaceae bacterium]
MLTEEERKALLEELKAKLRDLEVFFQDTESSLGELRDDEKRHLKGLASAVKYHASKLI